MAVLVLHSYIWALSGCSKQGLPFIAVRRLLNVVLTSLMEQQLRCTGFSR